MGKTPSPFHLSSYFFEVERLFQIVRNYLLYLPVSLNHITWLQHTLSINLKKNLQHFIVANSFEQFKGLWRKRMLRQKRAVLGSLSYLKPNSFVINYGHLLREHANFSDQDFFRKLSHAAVPVGPQIYSLVNTFFIRKTSRTSFLGLLFGSVVLSDRLFITHITTISNANSKESRRTLGQKIIHPRFHFRSYVHHLIICTWDDPKPINKCKTKLDIRPTM